jgi:hypothetical protein
MKTAAGLVSSFPMLFTFLLLAAAYFGLYSIKWILEIVFLSYVWCLLPATFFMLGYFRIREKLLNKEFFLCLGWIGAGILICCLAVAYDVFGVSGNYID